MNPQYPPADARGNSNREEKFVTRSAQETLRWAETFAGQLVPGDVVALVGELGAGKTVMAKGIGRGLGIKEDVISPTFNYVLEYQGRLPLFHADLYRIEGAAMFQAMGLDEYFDRRGVFVIEWAERIREILPPETIWITLQPQEDERLIQVRRGA